MADQNSQFMAILTAVGEARLANATALGVPWNITQLGVGDGNGAEPMPIRTQTALINERRRAPLNQLSIDPNNSSIIIAEQVIPEDVGGWWIREIGLYDEAGDLVAVANCPPTYKPELAQGSGRTQVVRLNLIVSSTQSIQLKIDPSVVLATRRYVDDLTVRAGQAEAETGTENTKIMTALRVWQAITKRFSTQAQAETGTDNATVMTPLRVAQALAKTVVQATETVVGTAKVATQTQTNSGTDDATIVTPKKLRLGFSIYLARIGYIAFPTWLGGFVLQWGSLTLDTVATVAVDTVFPVAFPNKCLSVVAGIGVSHPDYDSHPYYRSDKQSVSIGVASVTGFEGQAFMDTNSGDSRHVQWLAVGY